MTTIGISDRIAAKQSAPSFFNKDTKVGDTISGIVKAASFRQSRDFATNQPETWEDGTPKEQLAVMLTDAALADGKDNGDRMIFIKWWGVQAKDFAATILESGATDLETGGTLTVTYTGEGEAASKGKNPPKLYTFDYQRA